MADAELVDALGEALRADDLLRKERDADIRGAHEHGAHRHVLGAAARLVVGHPVVAGKDLDGDVVDAVRVEQAVLDANGDGQDLEHRARLVGGGHGLEREGVRAGVGEV